MNNETLMCILMFAAIILWGVAMIAGYNMRDNKLFYIIHGYKPTKRKKKRRRYKMKW